MRAKKLCSSLFCFVSKMSPNKAVELQTGEISVEISIDVLRLIIRDNIRLWNWGVRQRLQDQYCDCNPH